MFDLSECKKGKQGHWLAQTRDGRDAVVFANDMYGDYKLAGCIINSDRKKSPAAWLSGGQFVGINEHSADLVNIPKKRAGWINCYKDGSIGVLSSTLKKSRVTQYSKDLFARIYITFTEGEGLDDANDS